ncbi:hypothetical protein COBT_003433, partial [Conglomerata obtusa]
GNDFGIHSNSNDSEDFSFVKPANFNHLEIRKRMFIGNVEDDAQVLPKKNSNGTNKAFNSFSNNKTQKNAIVDDTKLVSSKLEIFA